MFASNQCSVDLKAIYHHLGSMFWMYLHLWFFFKKMHIKILWYIHRVLWKWYIMKQPRLCQRQKRLYYYNQGLVLKWTSQLFLHSHFFLFLFMLNTLLLHWNRAFHYPRSENMNTKQIKPVFESDLHFWVHRFKSIMQIFLKTSTVNAKKSTLIFALRWIALPHNLT